MQLKIRRGQRAGMLGGKVVFTLDLMVDLTPDEHALVERYKLWSEVAYSHSTAEQNAQNAQSGSLKALGAVIADRVLKKILTIKDFVAGQHVECKDLQEVLAVEEQVRGACANIQRYLAIAVSFDGREEVVEVERAA